MWVITYRGKPATKEKLFELMKMEIHPYDTLDKQEYISFPKKSYCISEFERQFHWDDRANGIECHRARFIKFSFL